MQIIEREILVMEDMEEQSNEENAEQLCPLENIRLEMEEEATVVIKEATHLQKVSEHKEMMRCIVIHMKTGK